MVVGNDPPASVGEEGVLGGFKIVQSDMHQVVYGADSEGLCECYIILCVILFYILYTYESVDIYFGESGYYSHGVIYYLIRRPLTGVEMDWF